MDAYMAERMPGFKPMTQEQLHESIMRRHPDANANNMQHFIDLYNERFEENLRGPGVRIVGVRITSPFALFCHVLIHPQRMTTTHV